MRTSESGELRTHIRWYETGFWKPRIDIVLRQIGDWKDKELLDVGCGIGTFSIETANRGAKVTAVDAFDESIRICRKMLAKYKLARKVDVVRANALSLPFGSDEFDVVIAADIIEHISDPAGFLEEIKRVGKPDSLLVCTTKNALSLYLLLGYLIHGHMHMALQGLKSLYKIFKHEERGRVNPYISYVGHVNEYDPIRLRLELRRKNFKIKYHATFSWNWRAEWKNLNRIVQPFFSSRVFEATQDKLPGLFLGHDQVIAGENIK